MQARACGSEPDLMKQGCLSRREHVEALRDLGKWRVREPGPSEVFDTHPDLDHLSMLGTAWARHEALGDNRRLPVAQTMRPAAALKISIDTQNDSPLFLRR